MSVARLLFSSLAGLALFVTQPAVAADDASETLRFQRVMVPAERVKDWPKDEGKYLPVDAADFDRLVSASQTRAGEACPASAIAAASYEARLSGEQLVGHAEAQVTLSGTAPAMLNFEPCNLAMSKVEWAGPTFSPATVGLASDGKLQALVERSGQLRFDWSLAGRHDSSDILSFLVEIPRAPAGRLTLDLPDDLDVAIDHGLIESSESAGRHTRRWQIQLGGVHRFRLRVLPKGAPARRSQLALLREVRTYEFSLRGVEVSVQWRLQAHNEPLRQITVAPDPGLRLVSARCGDVSLPMSLVPKAGRPSGVVVLALPEPIREVPRTVRLSLIGPIELNKPWKLPGVRAEGLFWQEGTITLLMPQPLEVEQLDPLGCAQTAVGPLAGPRSGETMQFQAFQPGATVTVSVKRPASAPRLLSATTIGLASDQATARVAARFQAIDTVSFQLQARIAPHWTIEAAESTPSGGVADWTIEPDGAAQRLTLRLDPPLSPSKSLRLIVQARRPLATLPQQIEADDFLPIRFHGMANAKQLVAVDPIAGYDLKLSGDGRPKRLVDSDLRRDEMRLFATTPKGLLFELGSDARPPRISLVERRAPDVAPSATAASIDTCRLESWFHADGSRRNRATYAFPASMPPSLHLTLPPATAISDVRGVWINGQSVDWRSTSVGERSQVAIPLPVRPQGANVTIEWSSSEQRLAIVGTLAADQPEPDLPTKASTWTAWLPPGYEVVSPQDASSLVRRLTSVCANWLAKPDTSDTAPPAALGDTSGWTVSNGEVAVDAATEIQYVRAASMRLLGTAMLLFIAALACWGLAERRCVLAALVVCFAVAAVAVPAGYAPLASGGMFGAIFSLAWISLRRLLPLPVTSDGAGSVAASPLPGTTIVRAAPLGLLLAAMLMLQGSVARADTQLEPATQSAPLTTRTPPIHKVLVPIDAQKKPAGGTIHVPETLYQELYRHSVAAGKPQGYLIVAAAYRGSLAAEGTSRRLGIDVLRAQYEIEVFSAAARIRIPLGSDDTTIVPGGLLLDGRPLEPQNQSDAAVLTFEVPEPGRYRLDVSLRLTGLNTAAAAGFDIVIPRVPQSRLELALPIGGQSDAFPGDPAVEVPSACGGTRIVAEPSRFQADLGPAERLIVRWREPGSRRVAGPVFDVDQLLWLKIQPGSVVIATKCRLHVVDGSLQNLSLAVDPRLRLLPLTGDKPPSVALTRESGESRVFTFHWLRPVENRADLEATFLLSGATGVGTFHVPPIEIADARSIARRMAVSVDAGLNREIHRNEAVAAVPVTTFLGAWRSDSFAGSPPNEANDTKPMAAYRLPPIETTWHISTRPLEPRTSARCDLSLNYDLDRVDVTFDAHLSTGSGYLFQYRLTAPKDLRIDDISLSEEGINRVSRWTQDDAGRITVFLNGAASGEQKLTLRGHLPAVIGQAAAAPCIGLERCEIKTTMVRVLASPAVVVDVHRAERAGAEPTPNTGTDSSLGRLVDTFSYEGAQSPAVTVTTSDSPPPAR